MTKKIKILVVDDDSMIGEMLKAVLEFKGYEVLVSGKPNETEENIIENNIDLVILDKLISGVDGTDVCSKVKGNDKTSYVKILIMTALHNAGPECLEAGADGFMTKPFDMKILYKNVETLLNQ
tara:strand:- start:142 stop:510 length:369 start_codon:yes stop_codon:yes gene_type:complete